MKPLWGWLIMGALIWASASFGQEYQAWIVTELDGSHWKVKAFCRAPAEGYLEYRLEAEKRGRTGRSASSQSGRVFVGSGEEKLLSQLRLKVSQGDRYRIELEVYKQGKKVAEDSLVYPPADPYGEETEKKAGPD